MNRFEWLKIMRSSFSFSLSFYTSSAVADAGPFVPIGRLCAFASRVPHNIPRLCQSLQSMSNEWSVTDDWERLSSENNPVESSNIFNVDLARHAALSMQKEKEDDEISADPEDTFVFDTVDSIINPMPDGSDPPLYDTSSSFNNYADSQSFIDEAGKEIGLLVRCNERPEDLLVSEGRALPPLTNEERHDPAQLVDVLFSDEGEPKCVPTQFLRNSVSRMFREHAVSKIDNEDGPVLDAAAIAKWMSKSLGESVGRHDKRVHLVISRFGSYGSGVLVQPQFELLYMDAITSGLRGLIKGSILKGDETKRREAIMKQLKMIQPGIHGVWRDFSNHGILSPAEVERQKQEKEMEEKFGASAKAGSIHATHTMMDECEILDWGDHDYSSSYFDIAKEESDATKPKTRGSHKYVEMASDKMTPKRIRDGQFVFIDEESCIGCAMCAQIAPSSFAMLESGRARAFSQSNAPEVASAVSSCPVNCMHNVAFHELKEIELARDEGDGRTDHRHFGSSHGHTPLNVAGIDSDANHKSSWYHYLKQKCYVSSDCPKRGCYDCPMFSAPGENPYFKKLHQKSDRIRAQDFIASGDADMWRKTVDL